MRKMIKDRKQAGQLLVPEISHLLPIDRRQCLILALPRGGVSVGVELAMGLNIPMEVLVVRKVGHPFHPEYGIGAVAEGGIQWIDPEAEGVSQFSEEEIQKIVDRERREINRRVELYRQNRPLPKLEGKTVILVDDGLATGVTARVAVKFLRSQNVDRIIMALPVCSRGSANALRSQVDSVICLFESSQFLSVGYYYHSFEQLTDDEVLDLLAQYRLQQSQESKVPVFISSNEVGTLPLQREVAITLEGGVFISGLLSLPLNPKGVVIFAHGSGSGRHSPRNQWVAQVLNHAGISTLLLDLLTEAEMGNRANVFDIPFLASRLLSAYYWIRNEEFGRDAMIGFFGASTGAGAALWAASELRTKISAVVSRGGRPDLAGDRLPRVTAPTLLIVGELDPIVIALNKEASTKLLHSKISIIPGAGHLFEGPGEIELVASQAKGWFLKYFEDYSQDKKLSVFDNIASEVKKIAVAISSRLDLQNLINDFASKRIVMLGESTHGTQEFYQWRAMITEELIEHQGFRIIAVEGDWPACNALNDFIHGRSILDIHEVLRKFHRWPTWMWANTEVREFIIWLKDYNSRNKREDWVSFYGLDVYSLFESMDEVLRHLKKINPESVKQVQKYYECFDSFFRDEKAYAKSLGQSTRDCERQVLVALQEILKLNIENYKEQYDSENYFQAKQNARIVANAERYYRAMIRGHEESWNVRDYHMVDMLDQILERHGKSSKVVVWAHNTHIGDYRATDMVEYKLVNLGGLAREKWGPENVALVGFGTYQGKVTASSAWDGPIDMMQLPPAKPNSIEAVLHDTAVDLGVSAFYFWPNRSKDKTFLKIKIGHRAVGVVYRTDQEHSNYVPTILADRYDCFMFIDQTKPIIPIHLDHIEEDIPETWPSGT